MNAGNRFPNTAEYSGALFQAYKGEVTHLSTPYTFFWNTINKYSIRHYDRNCALNFTFPVRHKHNHSNKKMIN